MTSHFKRFHLFIETLDFDLITDNNLLRCENKSLIYWLLKRSEVELNNVIVYIHCWIAECTCWINSVDKMIGNINLT